MDEHGHDHNDEKHDVLLSSEPPYRWFTGEWSGTQKSAAVTHFSFGVSLIHPYMRESGEEGIIRSSAVLDSAERTSGAGTLSCAVLW